MEEAPFTPTAGGKRQVRPRRPLARLARAVAVERRCSHVVLWTGHRSRASTSSAAAAVTCASSTRPSTALRLPGSDQLSACDGHSAPTRLPASHARASAIGVAWQSRRASLQRRGSSRVANTSAPVEGVRGGAGRAPGTRTRRPRLRAVAQQGAGAGEWRHRPEVQRRDPVRRVEHEVAHATVDQLGHRGELVDLDRLEFATGQRLLVDRSRGTWTTWRVVERRWWGGDVVRSGGREGVWACPAPPGLCEPCGAGRHSTRGAARTSPGRWSRRWTAPCGRSPRRRCRGWPSPRGGARGPTHHHRHTVKERREPDPSHLQGARAWWPFSSAAAPPPSACTGAATACITAHVVLPAG